MLYRFDKGKIGSNGANLPTVKLKPKLTPIDNYVDITGNSGQHILNGHRSGTGKPGKTEFPASWNDNRILHQVSDIATDPNAIRGVDTRGTPYVIGVRDGIEIRVNFSLIPNLMDYQIQKQAQFQLPIQLQLT